MSHHDKFWEKFGQKIRGHQPEAYTSGSWRAMEELLDKPARPSQRRNKALFALVLLAAAVGYLAGARYGFPSAPVRLGAFPIPLAGVAATEEKAGMDTMHNTLSLHPKQGAGAEVSLPPKPAATGLAGRAKRSPGEAGSPEKGVYAESMFGGQETLPILETPITSVQISGQGLIPQENTPSPAFNEQLPQPSVIAALLGPASSQAAAGRNEGFAVPDRERSRLFGGALIGFNRAVISIADDSYSNYPFGGLFGGLRFSPRWAIQAEAHLKYVDNIVAAYEQSVTLESNNGYAFDQVSTGVAEKNYLAFEFPFVAKYKVAPAWNLIAGLRPGLILDNPSFPGRNADAPTVDLNNSGQSRENTSGELALRHFDLGVAFGMEWLFYRGWSLDARFTRGLRDLSPENVFQAGNKHFNTDFQLSARRKF